MLKKIKPYACLITATAMVFTTFGSVRAEEVKKPRFLGSNNVMIGDMYLTFNVTDVINAMAYAISERGYDPNTLNVFYGRRKADQEYFDFRKEFSVAESLKGDAAEAAAKAWTNVKVQYDPEKNIAVPFIGDVPVNETTEIKVRPGYEGIIDIKDKKVEIPDGTTPKILKGAIQSVDGIFGQTYEFYDGDKKITDDDVKLVDGNKLKVIAESGADDTYDLVVKSSGGSSEVDQKNSTAIKFKDDLTKGTISTPIKVAVDPLVVSVESAEEGKTVEDENITYQWYKQTIGTSTARSINAPIGEPIKDETTNTFEIPVDTLGTTLYYVIATNTEKTETGEDKNPSSIISNMVTVVVTEGEFEEEGFTVGKYVYNNESKSTDTMGMIEGEAPKGAVITIEANYKNLLGEGKSITVGDDKQWKATFPRQNAGTIIKVTAALNGKSYYKDIPVLKADDKALDDFRKSIDLNKLIEVRNNLHISKDDTGNDITEGYWVKNSEKLVAESFTSYVNLIEKVLDYKYQISDVDLKYIQSIAIPALETYKDKIFKVDGNKEATSKLTLSVGGNGNGTLAIKDKDAGAIVKDDSTVGNIVYILNNNKKVTITATPNASNAVAGWLVDEQPSVGEIKNLKELELSINKDTSVQAIFAPEKDAPIIQEVIDIVKEITNNGEKPFEVSISNDNPTLDEVKTFVESTIKNMLPKGAEVDEIKIEEAKTRATKNYTATVTFKVGDVTFTITIEISVNTGVSEVDLTLKLTGAEHGTVVSVMQEGKDVSTKGSVYTVKPGAEVIFTVAPNPGYKAKWSENVKEVTTGNPNVVTITPTASNTITLDFVEDKENTSAITLNVDPNGAVKVEVDGTSLTPTGNVYTVENGKTVTFTAIPKIGFEVDSWTGATVDPTNKNVATLKVTDKATVGVTFKEEGKEDPDQTTDAIKILSMQVDGGNFENISQSVTTNVYSNTVDGAVYQIYASLSDPVAKFNTNGEATFKFTLTAYSDSENFTGSAVTNFLEGLQIDTTRKVLMKELKPIESPTRELEITLSTEVIKSTDVDNPTEFTINFTYRGSADSNKVKPLVGKAIQIKATTEN